jgi:hypothetical protein
MTWKLVKRQWRHLPWLLLSYLKLKYISWKRVRELRKIMEKGGRGH